MRSPATRRDRDRDQEEFVRWWRESVSTRQGGGEKLSRGSAQKFSMDNAEATTGITHQQVSKWAKRLKRDALSTELRAQFFANLQNWSEAKDYRRSQ
jgi:hypothetical protein